MKRVKLSALVVLLLFSASFWGCGGGGAKVKTHHTTTSLGQEFSDLDEAHKMGIITDKEYKKAKKGLMKRYK